MDKVTAPASGESAKIKVKVQVNIHGVFNVYSASQVEKLEVMEAEEKVTAGTADEEPMEQNGPVDNKGDTSGGSPKDDAAKSEPVRTYNCITT